MSKTNSLYDTMSKLWAEFDSNHNSFAEKGNKAAGVRLRKSLRKLKQFSGDFVKFTLKG